MTGWYFAHPQDGLNRLILRIFEGTFLPDVAQMVDICLTLSVPNFRRHLLSAFYFNKLSLGKKYICKVDRLNIKQRRSRWDGSMSRLIWIYVVCKSLLLSPVAMKKLTCFFLFCPRPQPCLVSGAWPISAEWTILPNGLVNSLDRLISSRRGVWLLFTTNMFYTNLCIWIKQFRLWSDAKKCLRICATWEFRPFCAYAKYYPGLCSLFISFIYPGLCFPFCSIRWFS